MSTAAVSFNPSSFIERAPVRLDLSRLELPRDELLRALPECRSSFLEMLLTVDAGLEVAQRFCKSYRCARCGVLLVHRDTERVRDLIRAASQIYISVNPPSLEGVKRWMQTQGADYAHLSLRRGRDVIFCTGTHKHARGIPRSDAAMLLDIYASGIEVRRGAKRAVAPVRTSRAWSRTKAEKRRDKGAAVGRSLTQRVQIYGVSLKEAHARLQQRSDEFARRVVEPRVSEITTTTSTIELEPFASFRFETHGLSNRDINQLMDACTRR